MLAKIEFKHSRMNCSISGYTSLIGFFEEPRWGVDHDMRIACGLAERPSVRTPQPQLRGITRRGNSSTGVSILQMEIMKSVML